MKKIHILYILTGSILVINGSIQCAENEGISRYIKQCAIRAFNAAKKAEENTPPAGKIAIGCLACCAITFGPPLNCTNVVAYAAAGSCIAQGCITVNKTIDKFMTEKNMAVISEQIKRQ